MTIGSKILDCQHGPDRKKNAKDKLSRQKITDNTERLRRGMSDRLRTDVKNGQRPQFERRIYISLPLEEDHKDHVLGEVGGMLQPIDRSLVEKIYTLVGEGVKTVDEMKSHGFKPRTTTTLPSLSIKMPETTF
ncbi:uncharacterized protein LOC122964756 [Acropora millepora]|uniref:uncharacterized protein LOC122964756 n=1 Tax=Acropora millepora TaxID=45264 RepID=UPI001CF0EAD3|nr:uncharacterized protein LOC122964756 [Acropora millepora]